MGFDVADRWLHPEGIHVLQLVDVEETAGQYGDQMKWIWESEVKREDGEPPRLSHWTGTKFSPRSNLQKMFEAIGLPIPETRDEAKALTPDSFIGTRCRAQVTHDLSKDGSTWANIKQFAPLKKAGGNGAAPAPTVKPEPAPAGEVDPFDAE